MKKIILIIMLFPIFGFTQFSNNYKEFNGGLYIGGEDVPVFPGISFLIGKTNYYSNNIVLDYEQLSWILLPIHVREFRDS